MKFDDLNGEEMHEHLVTDYQPLIHQLTHRLIKSGHLSKDYHPDENNAGAEAALHGLNKAIVSWDKSKGNKFKTHVWNTVRGELLNHYSAAQNIPTSLKNAARSKRQEKTRQLRAAQEVKPPPQKPIPLPDDPSSKD